MKHIELIHDGVGRRNGLRLGKLLAIRTRVYGDAPILDGGTTNLITIDDHDNTVRLRYSGVVIRYGRLEGGIDDALPGLAALHLAWLNARVPNPRRWHPRFVTILRCPNVCGPVPKLDDEITACERYRFHRGWHEAPSSPGKSWWSRGTGHRSTHRIAAQVRSRQQAKSARSPGQYATAASAPRSDDGCPI